MSACRYACALAILATLSGLADARPPGPSRLPPEAAAWLARGNKHLERQQYDQALAAYQAGYDVIPEPIFLYNIGQAKRLAGDCAGAVEAYQRFLATRPEPPQVASARRNIARCPVAPPEPSPAPAAAPAPAPPAAPPPAAVAPVGSSPPRASPRSPWYTDVLGGVLAGGALAAGGAGTWLYLDGRATVLDENERAAAAPDSEEASRHLAAARRGYTREKAGAALLAAGGALAVGAVLRYTLRDGEGDAPSPAITLVPASGGFLVTLGGTLDR